MHSINIEIIQGIIVHLLNKESEFKRLNNSIQDLVNQEYLFPIGKDLQVKIKVVKLDLLDIERKKLISSYVARHSYATNAKKLGVPTAIISEALGHKTEMITQVYLDSFENDVVDQYHNLIIDLKG